MKKLFFLLLFTAFTTTLFGQQPIIHSHNDYRQDRPFYNAYEAGAKSIEVDVFLKGGDLYAAHTFAEIKKGRTFEKLYVEPLMQLLIDGKPINTVSYLVDIKTAAVPAMQMLVEQCNKHPEIFNATANGVKLYISGNRPPQDTYKDYPAYIFFDGRDPKEKELPGGDRIGLISRNFSDFTNWRGKGNLPVIDSLQIFQFVAECHSQNLPVRFWNTPDNTAIYSTLLNLNVDFINTDKPADVAQYLQERKKAPQK